MLALIWFMRSLRMERSSMIYRMELCWINKMLSRWFDSLRITPRRGQIFLLILKSTIRESAILEVRSTLLLKLDFMRLLRLNRRRRERTMSRIWSRKRTYRWWRVWRDKYTLLNRRHLRNRKRRNNKIWLI